MTRTQYATACLLQSFGITRKTKRLTAAAFEMHLVQDGEELLGALCWSKTENIEELSMEYWNLRRLERERQSFNTELEKAEEKLSEAQAKRSTLLEGSVELGKDLFEKRDDLLNQVEKIELENEQIMIEADKTKRKISALRMKTQVLAEESEGDLELTQKRIEKGKAEIAVLREAFQKYRDQINANQSLIKKIESKLAHVREKIDSELRGSENITTAVFAEISEANRAISKIRSKIGIIQTSEGPLFKKMGHFLVQNSKRKDCLDACRQYRSLLRQIQLVSKSAMRNRRLVERLT